MIVEFFFPLGGERERWMGRTSQVVGVRSAEGPRIAAGAKWLRHQRFIIAERLSAEQQTAAAPQDGNASDVTVAPFNLHVYLWTSD